MQSSRLRQSKPELDGCLYGLGQVSPPPEGTCAPGGGGVTSVPVQFGATFGCSLQANDPLAIQVAKFATAPQLDAIAVGGVEIAGGAGSPCTAPSRERDSSARLQVHYMLLFFFLETFPSPDLFPEQSI